MRWRTWRGVWWRSWRSWRTSMYVRVCQGFAPSRVARTTSGLCSPALAPRHGPSLSWSIPAHRGWEGIGLGGAYWTKGPQTARTACFSGRSAPRSGRLLTRAHFTSPGPRQFPNTPNSLRTLVHSRARWPRVVLPGSRVAAVDLGLLEISRAVQRQDRCSFVGYFRPLLLFLGGLMT